MRHSGITRPTLAFLALLLGAGLVLAPVQAQAASFRAPAGLTQSAAEPGAVTMRWTAVAKAPRYRLQVSTTSSMAKATYHRFTGTTGTVKGLASGATYYVKVRVIAADGTNLGPYSSAVRTTSGRTTPAPSGLASRSATASSITFGWKAVSGAPRYRIQLSRSSSMAGATYHRFTGTSGTVNGLVSGATYYAKVRVITEDGTNLGPYSGAVTASTSKVVTLPAPSGLKATAAGTDTLSTSWNAVAGAPRYRLQISTAPTMAGATYVRETSTRRVLDGLQTDTTYYVKVRVIDADGANLSPYSAAVQVRTKVVPRPLEVATYNVRCANCFEGPAKGRPEELPWVQRRDAVVSTIAGRAPDVVGLQEASQGWLKDAAGKQVNLSQFEDVRDRLRKVGVPYELANKHRNNCVKSTTPTGCTYKDQGASQGTKLLYNTATTTLKRSGSKALPRCSGCNERYVAWGVFEQKSTRMQYFVANTHIEPGVDKESWRSSQLKALVAEVKKRNTDDLPVLVVGDLNQTRYAGTSFVPRDILVGAGLVDPLGHVFKSRSVAPTATAEKRVRAHYNSYGGFQRTVTSYGATENGSNLDYVFTSPMRVLQHETVLDLDAAGRLRGVVPSDHQMLLATVLLPV